MLPVVHPDLSVAEIDALGRAPQARPGALQWVRPLHAIVATFGLETEQPDVVKFAVDGIAAGQTTFGHRFMAPERDPGAPLGRAARRNFWTPKSCSIPEAPQGRHSRRGEDHWRSTEGFELVEDQGLLDEVAGLVEWPVVLMGWFNEGIPVDPGRGDPRHHPQ